MEDRRYHVYIRTNQANTVIYTGVTNNLQRRVLEHRSGKGGVFSNKHKLNKLVYFESRDDVQIALLLEKQIKAGSRNKKIELINSINPTWEDLFQKYFIQAEQ